LLFFAQGSAVGLVWGDERERLEYNRDIRPILVENCFACHGPDSAARKADLRLDRRDSAMEAGAIVPGDPGASELVARVTAQDPKEVMPPRSTGKSLTGVEREMLIRWIREGAPYQPHWSLIPPSKPPIPRVHNQAWLRNPIDSFILARLEASQLEPAPQAARETLARRVALDLTGLAPETGVLDDFLHDSDPDAYERLVDRLLSSPRWGEHRARFWLDSARYADTNGYHFDNYREAWAYRDWVISAFNRNLPYDQFAIEQIAGDLLPDATLDQQVASGFNRCNATTNEGGVIPEEYKVLYARDRTETVCQVFMGLTAGCAVCHDHKFDPLTQREFYALSAFFNNTTQPIMDGNAKDTPPTVFVPAVQDRPRYESLSRRKAEIETGLVHRRQSARAAFDRWLDTLGPNEIQALDPSAGRALAVMDLAQEETPRVKSYESPWFGDYEKDQPFSFGAWIQVPDRRSTGSILARMDDRENYRGWDLWLEGDRVAAHLVHHWPDDAVKVVTRNPIPIGDWTHVFVTYDGSGKAGGVSIYVDGRKREATTAVDQLRGPIRTGVPFKVGQRHTGSRLERVIVHDVRLYDLLVSETEIGLIGGLPRAVRLAAEPASSRSRAESDAVYAWWLAALDPETKGLRQRLAEIEGEISTLRARGTYAQVMHERGEPAQAHVLFRGEYDKKRELVKPDTPHALPAFPASSPRNRLGLARWLVDPGHPLTARVAVNRFWQEIFGTGLVRTSGDFGISGELPSHPELLDYLAIDFRESGWDVKRLFRLIVTSAAYRQAAVVTPLKRERDSANRLLSRGPRFRMDGEMIRDLALETSGLLVSRIGGPSVKPYQPDGVWEAVAMPESNTHFYRQDHGDKLYRRSLYTFWKRSAPPASLEIFNAPTRETCTVRRERTNTPLQALVTLNDPQFVEAARALATRVLAQPFSDLERIQQMSRRLLARPLRPDEATVAAASLARLAEWYQSRPHEAGRLISVGESRPDPSLEPARLAAWTMLANELMNLDEFLNK